MIETGPETSIFGQSSEISNGKRKQDRLIHHVSVSISEFLENPIVVNVHHARELSACGG